MYPVICKIGPFAIYSYGLMLALAFIICIFLLQREAKKRNINPLVISDSMFWILIASLAGARVFYVILNLRYFINNPVEIIMLHRGGLVWYGGFVFGSLTGVFYLRRKGLSIFKSLDLFAPYIALGQAIGRAGCFLNGCCYGRPVSWGIYFPVHGMRLNPIQIFSSLTLFIIFLILFVLQKRKQPEGKIFFIYVLLHSLSRFFIEYFRADTPKYLLGLSVFQIIGIGLFFISIYGIFYTKSKSGR